MDMMGAMLKKVTGGRVSVDGIDITASERKLTEK